MALRIDEALARAGELAEISDTPLLDTQLLLEHCLDCSRAYLYTWPERALSAPQAAAFEALLARRLQGEPVAHILGCRDFWTLTLEVNPSTLIPRPDTERLVELGLERLSAAPARVADLGTGTGAIALALASERPAWSITAVERDSAALALAERNRERLGYDNVEVVAGSWCEPLEGRYAMILSNPPYIDAADPHLTQGDVRFEPRSALVAPEAGLGAIRTIATQALDCLEEAGWLLFEHGYDQGPRVAELLRGLGYRQVATYQDLGGNDRVTLGRRGT
ncbi:peptide chain release factor N(5)-glutamine methyltransferase [Motiliproteus sp. SC1-56]|uniref:peptide chain release factor N(5)-glutamine methyltransferase n=1 Tax=Motiliproteus sp. SC1-56 TaxID=2799565 RepID=UPI001A8FCCE0|nr:peptide chain release factor N(5)-glutamine methyltransferase [Motiliproteus sp. SC1-56]